MKTREEISQSSGITWHNTYQDSTEHPEGFESVYLYNSSKSFSRDSHYHQWLDQDPNIVQVENLRFFINDDYPKLPLILKDEIWSTGWDISTEYAVDADKQCWMGDAHGGALRKVNNKELLREFEDKDQRIQLEKLLELEPSYIPCPCCGSLVLPRDIKENK